jgi:hypothetical protein
LKESSIISWKFSSISRMDYRFFLLKPFFWVI